MGSSLSFPEKVSILIVFLSVLVRWTPLAPNIFSKAVAISVPVAGCDVFIGTWLGGGKVTRFNGSGGTACCSGGDSCKGGVKSGGLSGLIKKFSIRCCSSKVITDRKFRFLTARYIAV